MKPGVLGALVPKTTELLTFAMLVASCDDKTYENDALKIIWKFLFVNLDFA